MRIWEKEGAKSDVRLAGDQTCSPLRNNTRWSLTNRSPHFTFMWAAAKYWRAAASPQGEKLFVVFFFLKRDVAATFFFSSSRRSRRGGASLLIAFYFPQSRAGVTHQNVPLPGREQLRDPAAKPPLEYQSICKAIFFDQLFKGSADAWGMHYRCIPGFCRSNTWEGILASFQVHPRRENPALQQWQKK